MSLKENITMVKEELNSEEKFFEKAVITERFLKKYGKLIASVLVVLILIAVGDAVYEANKQSKIEAANAELAKLIKNPNASSKKLKELSPILYDVWQFQNAIEKQDVLALKKLKQSKSPLVSDLASYEVAKTKEELEAYTLKQNAIYKDLAILRSAILLMKDNKIAQAHTKLSTIPANSPLAKAANVLKHYGVK